MVNETEHHQFRRIRRFLRISAWTWLTAQILLTLAFMAGVARSFGYKINLLTFLPLGIQTYSSAYRVIAMLGISVMYGYIVVRMVIGCARNMHSMYIFSLNKVEQKAVLVYKMNEQFGTSVALMVSFLFLTKAAHNYTLSWFGMLVLVMCFLTICFGAVLNIFSKEQLPSWKFIGIYCLRMLFIIGLFFMIGMLLFHPQLGNIVSGIRTILMNKWENLHDIIYMLHHYLFSDLMWLIITGMYIRLLFLLLNSVECFDGHLPVPQHEYRIAHGTAVIVPLMTRCLVVVLIMIAVKWVVGLFFTGNSPLGLLTFKYVIKWCISIITNGELQLLLILTSGLIMFNIRFLPGDEICEKKMKAADATSIH